MEYLAILSFGSTTLAGFAIFLIGRLLLKLHSTTIQITKRATSKRPWQEEITTDTNIEYPDSLPATDNSPWEPVTISVQWGTTLSILAYLRLLVSF